jgi:hypothetical protein
LLALRRDVILAEPLEINIDLATEGLPVMRTQVSHPSCTLVSTFSFGQTRVELANVSDTIIYAPHPDQWRVGDRLSVLRLCDGRSYVVDDLVSPFQALPPFEQPPNVDPLAPDVSNDRWHFAWNAYESPVEYELVVAGDPCFPLVLVGVEALSRGCRHRWTARITEGWTAGGGTELDVISRAELEALGVWSDSLELPHPLSWALFADRDGTDRRTRAFHNGTIE